MRFVCLKWKRDEGRTVFASKSDNTIKRKLVELFTGPYYQNCHQCELVCSKSPNKAHVLLAPMEVTGDIDDKDDRLEFVCLSCVQKCYSGYIQAKRGWVPISKPIADDKDFMLVKTENEKSKHGYQKCLNDMEKLRKDLLISVWEQSMKGYNITIRISRSG